MRVDRRQIHGKGMNAARQSCEHLLTMGDDPMEVFMATVTYQQESVNGGRMERLWRSQSKTL